MGTSHFTKACRRRVMGRPYDVMLLVMCVLLGILLPRLWEATPSVDHSVQLCSRPEARYSSSWWPPFVVLAAAAPEAPAAKKHAGYAPYSQYGIYSSDCRYRDDKAVVNTNAELFDCPAGRRFTVFVCTDPGFKDDDSLEIVFFSESSSRVLTFCSLFTWNSIVTPADTTKCNRGQWLAVDDCLVPLDDTKLSRLTVIHRSKTLDSNEEYPVAFSVDPLVKYRFWPTTVMEVGTHSCSTVGPASLGGCPPTTPIDIRLCIATQEDAVFALKGSNETQPTRISYEIRHVELWQASWMTKGMILPLEKDVCESAISIECDPSHTPSVVLRGCRLPPGVQITAVHIVRTDITDGVPVEIRGFTIETAFRSSVTEVYPASDSPACHLSSLPLGGLECEALTFSFYACVPHLPTMPFVSSIQNPHYVRAEAVADPFSKINNQSNRFDMKCRSVTVQARNDLLLPDTEFCAGRQFGQVLSFRQCLIGHSVTINNIELVFETPPKQRDQWLLQGLGTIVDVKVPTLTVTSSIALCKTVSSATAKEELESLLNTGGQPSEGSSAMLDHACLGGKASTLFLCVTHANDVFFDAEGDMRFISEDPSVDVVCGKLFFYRVQYDAKFCASKSMLVATECKFGKYYTSISLTFLKTTQLISAKVPLTPISITHSPKTMGIKVDHIQVKEGDGGCTIDAQDASRLHGCHVRSRFSFVLCVSDEVDKDFLYDVHDITRRDYDTGAITAAAVSWMTPLTNLDSFHDVMNCEKVITAECGDQLNDRWKFRQSVEFHNCALAAGVEVTGITLRRKSPMGIAMQATLTDFVIQSSYVVPVVKMVPLTSSSCVEQTSDTALTDCNPEGMSIGFCAPLPWDSINPVALYEEMESGTAGVSIHCRNVLITGTGIGDGIFTCPGPTYVGALIFRGCIISPVIALQSIKVTLSNSAEGGIGVWEFIGFSLTVKPIVEATNTTYAVVCGTWPSTSHSAINNAVDSAVAKGLVYTGPYIEKDKKCEGEGRIFVAMCSPSLQFSVIPYLQQLSFGELSVFGMQHIETDLLYLRAGVMGFCEGTYVVQLTNANVAHPSQHFETLSIGGSAEAAQTYPFMFNGFDIFFPSDYVHCISKSSILSVSGCATTSATSTSHCTTAPTTLTVTGHLPDLFGTTGTMRVALVAFRYWRERLMMPDVDYVQAYGCPQQKMVGCVLDMAAAKLNADYFIAQDAVSVSTIQENTETHTFSFTTRFDKEAIAAVKDPHDLHAMLLVVRSNQHPEEPNVWVSGCFKSQATVSLIRCPVDTESRSECGEAMLKGHCDPSTGLCDCEPSYYGPACATHLASGCGAPPTLCSGHGQCDAVSGRCVCDRNTAAGFWDGALCETCVEGYGGADCLSECPGGACLPCSMHGDCNAETLTCTCHPGWAPPNCSTCAVGYWGSSCQRLCPGLLADGSGKSCSGHGDCSHGLLGTGMCDCDASVVTGMWDGAACDRCKEGYMGAECNTRYPCLPPSGSAEPVCSGHGKCTADGCVCDSGYVGSTCSVVCPGMEQRLLSGSESPLPCNGHGTCSLAPGQIEPHCRCTPGFAGVACAECDVQHFGPDCAGICPACTGGTCDAGISGTGKCICRTGFTGSACATECPGGALRPCSLHGTCTYDVEPGNVEIPRCICSENDVDGHFAGPSCRECHPDYLSDDCRQRCPSTNGKPCDGYGDCYNGKCFCHADRCGSACEDTSLACKCPEAGQYGPTCQFRCPTAVVDGNEVTCGGHGYCDDGKEGTGSCTCTDGWRLQSCSKRCGGDTDSGDQCSGNGVCTDDAICKCHAAYVGEDCSIRCPGVNERGVACSGHGTCHVGPTDKALCHCNPPYVGVACDTFCSLDCSGHGTCAYRVEDDTQYCVCDSSEATGFFAGDRCEICEDGYSGTDCSAACLPPGGHTVGHECVCSEPYDGVDCATTCAADECGEHGTCRWMSPTQPVHHCLCDEDYYGLQCDKPCSNISCVNDNNGRGQCDALTGQCVCNNGDILGYWDIATRCSTCLLGYYGNACQYKCPCSGHGGCNALGVCNCFDSDGQGHFAGLNCQVCAEGYVGVACKQRSMEPTRLQSCFVEMQSGDEDLTASPRSTFVVVDEVFDVVIAGRTELLICRLSTRRFVQHVDGLMGAVVSGSLLAERLLLWVVPARSSATSAISTDELCVLAPPRGSSLNIANAVQTRRCFSVPPAAHSIGDTGGAPTSVVRVLLLPAISSSDPSLAARKGIALVVYSTGVLLEVSLDTLSLISTYDVSRKLPIISTAVALPPGSSGTRSHGETASGRSPLGEDEVTASLRSGVVLLGGRGADGWILLSFRLPLRWPALSSITPLTGALLDVEAVGDWCREVACTLASQVSLSYDQENSAEDAFVDLTVDTNNSVGLLRFSLADTLRYAGLFPGSTIPTVSLTPLLGALYPVSNDVRQSGRVGGIPVHTHTSIYDPATRSYFFVIDVLSSSTGQLEQPSTILWYSLQSRAIVGMKRLLRGVGFEWLQGAEAQASRRLLWSFITMGNRIIIAPFTMYGVYTVAPNVVDERGGTAVTVHGMGFPTGRTKYPTRCFFGDTGQVSVEATVDSSTQLKCVAPQGKRSGCATYALEFSYGENQLTGNNVFLIYVSKPTLTRIVNDDLPSDDDERSYAASEEVLGPGLSSRTLQVTLTGDKFTSSSALSCMVTLAGRRPKSGQMIQTFYGDEQFRESGGKEGLPTGAINVTNPTQMAVGISLSGVTVRAGEAHVTVTVDGKATSDACPFEFVGTAANISVFRRKTDKATKAETSCEATQWVPHTGSVYSSRQELVMEPLHVWVIDANGRRLRRVVGTMRYRVEVAVVSFEAELHSASADEPECDSRDTVLGTAWTDEVGVAVFDELSFATPAAGRYVLHFAVTEEREEGSGAAVETPPEEMAVAQEMGGSSSATWRGAFDVTVRAGEAHSLRLVQPPSPWIDNLAPILPQQPELIVVDASGNMLVDEQVAGITVVASYVREYTTTTVRGSSWSATSNLNQPYDVTLTKLAMTSRASLRDGTFTFDSIAPRGLVGQPYHITFEVTYPEGVKGVRSADMYVKDCPDGRGVPGEHMYFSISGRSECYLCPRGASCNGSTVLHTDGDNWWRASDDSYTFYSCAFPHSSGSCVAPYGSCREGYTGPRCSVCRPGFGKVHFACLRCGGKGIAALIGYTILSMMLPLIFVGVAQLIAYHSYAMDVLPAVLRMVIDFLQTCCVLGRAQSALPAWAAWFFRWQEELSAVARPELLPFTCMGANWTAYHDMYVAVLLPLYVIVVYTAFFLVWDGVVWPSWCSEERKNRFYTALRFRRGGAPHHPTPAPYLSRRIATRPLQLTLSDVLRRRVCGPVSREGAIRAANRFIRALRYHERVYRGNPLRIDDRPQRFSFLEHFTSLVVVTLVLMVSSVATACMRLWHCEDIRIGSGDNMVINQVLVADRRLQCDTDMHRKQRLIALTFTLVYCVGTMASVWLCCRWSWRQTGWWHTSALYRFVVAGYRREGRWWWSSVVCLRKVCLVMIAGIMGSEAQYRDFLTWLVLAICVAVHAGAAPHYTLSHLRRAAIQYVEHGALMLLRQGPRPVTPESPTSMSQQSLIDTPILCVLQDAFPPSTAYLLYYVELALLAGMFACVNGMRLQATAPSQSVVVTAVAMSIVVLCSVVALVVLVWHVFVRVYCAITDTRREPFLWPVRERRRRIGHDSVLAGKTLERSTIEEVVGSIWCFMYVPLLPVHGKRGARAVSTTTTEEVSDADSHPGLLSNSNSMGSTSSANSEPLAEESERQHLFEMAVEHQMHVAGEVPFARLLRLQTAKYRGKRHREQLRLQRVLRQQIMFLENRVHFAERLVSMENRVESTIRGIQRHRSGLTYTAPGCGHLWSTPEAFRAAVHQHGKHILRTAETIEEEAMDAWNQARGANTATDIPLRALLMDKKQKRLQQRERKRQKRFGSWATMSAGSSRGRLAGLALGSISTECNSGFLLSDLDREKAKLSSSSSSESVASDKKTLTSRLRSVRFRGRRK